MPVFTMAKPRMLRFPCIRNANNIGLASAVFAALAMVVIRRLSNTEPAIRIVFYFSMISTLEKPSPCCGNGSFLVLIPYLQWPLPGLLQHWGNCY